MRFRSMQNDKEIFPILVPWLQQIINNKPNAAPQLVFKSVYNCIQEIIDRNLSEQFLNARDLFNLKMIQKGIMDLKEKKN
jgi:hypothetical protein